MSLFIYEEFVFVRLFDAAYGFKQKKGAGLMEPIIQAQELSFTYTRREDRPDLLALDGISLEIEQGSFVAVLGHNGSGKSTFAKHINAILTPTQGKMLVAGMDTAREELRFQIREAAGMVFQNPDNQIVATIVEEDAAFAPENLGLPPEEIRRRVDQALEAVGMAEYKNSSPHMLSGGQKQRVAIAGVLAMAPRIVVLDEPTAMLDPNGRREVMAAVRRLHQEQGITAVLITHHMDEAAQAQRVVVIEDGRVVADGPPRQIFSQTEMMREAGLGSPQTVEILEALNQEGFDLPIDALTVEECARRLISFLEG